jgi:hypothetical protein
MLPSTIPKKYYLLDSNFPNRLLRSGSYRTIEFVNYLFRDYSGRNLTNRKDRKLAISGLESRIAGALRCEHRYGVFQRHLHRNLLWQAIDKMEPIAYDSGTQVPSWSWMACHGRIRFVDIQYGCVSWVNALAFDENYNGALITTVGEFTGCNIERDGACHTILDGSGVRRGWIQYDVEDSGELSRERCVVVGKESDRTDCWRKSKSASGVENYFVLIVRPTSVDDEYKRVGVGSIQSCCVIRERSQVRIV